MKDREFIDEELRALGNSVRCACGASREAHGVRGRCPVRITSVEHRDHKVELVGVSVVDGRPPFGAFEVQRAAPVPADPVATVATSVLSDSMIEAYRDRARVVLTWPEEVQALAYVMFGDHGWNRDKAIAVLQKAGMR